MALPSGHVVRLPAEGPRPVDARGRLTLPPEVLKSLKLDKGGYVEFVIKGDAVTIKRVEWRSP